VYHAEFNEKILKPCRQCGNGQKWSRKGSRTIEEGGIGRRGSRRERTRVGRRKSTRERKGRRLRKRGKRISRARATSSNVCTGRCSGGRK
jgi:hypothetical protein